MVRLESLHMHQPAQRIVDRHGAECLPTNLLLVPATPPLQTAVLLIENDINTSPFTPAVHACVPPLPWAVSAQDIAEPGRMDLRDLCICSVDPPGWVAWPACVLLAVTCQCCQTCFCATAYRTWQLRASPCTLPACAASRGCLALPCTPVCRAPLAIHRTLAATLC